MDQMLEIEKMKSNKYILGMSVPIFVELMLQLLVGNIDQIMISRYSQESVAAIVNANQIMNIVIIVMNMLCMASTVVLTQSLGAKDHENSNRTATVSVAVIVFVSLLATGIVVCMGHAIYTAMHVQGAVLEQTLQYLSIVGGAILIQGLYLSTAAIVRSHTLLKEVMYAAVIMNVLNIAGNAVFINGLFGAPRLGILGAAISTAISKGIGLLLVVVMMYRKTKIRMKLSYLNKSAVRVLKKIVVIGLPSGTETLSYQICQLMILSLVNTFGTIAIVTKGYSGILANFAYVYAIAISQVCQIAIGYFIGGKQVEAIEKRVWSTCKISVAVCVGFTILLFVGSDYAFRLFTNDPDILALGHKILFIEIFLEIGRGINIVLTKCLVTVGEPQVPMIAGIPCHWLCGFLLSYVFGIVLHMGLVGIWIAIMIDECLRGFIYIIRFHSNRWKRKMADKFYIENV